MTLITYLTRVHFADGVLEEALRGEMEVNGKRRPLIVAEDGHLDGAVAERFFSSFPIRTAAETFTEVPRQPTEEAARRIAEIYRDRDCDLLIAFGSNRAMDIAKVSRIAIAHDEPIAALSNEEGGSQRINAGLPDLYSIPGVLGFASAISDYARVKLDAGGQVLLSSRRLIPDVAICDPTLTLGASAAETACAAAGIVARGVDAFLSPRYNPPADALAIDALSRVRTFASRAIQMDDLAARREMMASGLNSSLSLQKGICPVHAICNAISSAATRKLDPSALGGVIIPRLVEFYDGSEDRGECRVRRVLNIRESRALADGLDELMADWPTPKTLSALGVEVGALSEAARLASEDRAISNGPRPIGRGEIRDILERAH
ncbi:MAG: iron-containing alcohol dehydrogenase [Pseudomonadota bacterium]